MLGQFENAVAEALSLDDGRQTNLTLSDQSRQREVRHRPSHRKHSKVSTTVLFLFFLHFPFTSLQDTSVSVPVVPKPRKFKLNTFTFFVVILNILLLCYSVMDSSKSVLLGVNQTWLDAHRSLYETTKLQK